MPRTRLRVGSVSLALTAAAAATLFAVPQGGAADGPVLRPLAAYKITVTGQVTTQKIGDGGRPSDSVRGTLSWTHTYPRVTFEMFDGVVSIRGSLRVRRQLTAAGTAVAHYDHQSGVCGHDELGAVAGHESGTLRGRSTLVFGGMVPLHARGPFRWSFRFRSSHPHLGHPGMDGPAPACEYSYGSASDSGGLLSTSIRALNYDANNANLWFSGTKGRGKAGFPLDKLLAGKAFSYSSRGTNRDSQQVRGDLSYRGYAYVTDGSMKIVFTPVR